MSAPRPAQSPGPLRLRAEWLYPGDGPPLRDRLLTVERGGITAIEPDGGGEAVDLGSLAIIPGLINAHTHLEFSTLSRPLEPLEDFPEWIRSLIQWRREQAPDVTAIRRGLEECRTSGTTALGEIATFDWALEDQEDSPVPTITIFRELLGLSEEAVSRQVDVAQRFLACSLGDQARGRRAGLSPHAPYSVHPELFERLCRLAERANVPLAMHLAETPEELQLLDEGRGPLVDLLRDLGVWRGGLIPAGSRPLRFIERLARLPRVLIIHGNLLDEEEIAALARNPRMSVVYCPRTHAAMQTGEHPWRKMLQAGVNVALGTDSRASNPDLSLWKELQFLHRAHPELPASMLLRMGTINGAAALGMEAAGRLAPACRAELCVVRLSPDAARDPESQLFAPECEMVPWCELSAEG